MNHTATEILETIRIAARNRRGDNARHTSEAAIRDAERLELGADLLDRLLVTHASPLLAPSATSSPVAWLHVMDNTEGFKGAPPIRELTFTAKPPFGVSGVDYDESFNVTSTPLYAEANNIEDTTCQR